MLTNPVAPRSEEWAAVRPPLLVQAGWYVSTLVPARWRSWAARDIGTVKWRVVSVVTNVVLFGLIEAPLALLGFVSWVSYASSLAALAVANLPVFGWDALNLWDRLRHRVEG